MCTIMPMLTTEQRRFPAWYNYRTAEGVEGSAKLTDQTDWQVWRSESWWSSGDPRRPDPDAVH